MARKSPTLWDCFVEIRNPEIYRNFLIHIFVMIPAAVVMAFIARVIDRVVGFEAFIAWPWNLVAAIALFVIGGVIVVYSYGYLAILGEGSPGTHIDEGTKRMVVTGPYTMIRHPSVVGKLAGVVGLGLLSRSPTLTFIVIPLLLVYSLLTNRYLQERFCEAKFGETYRRYRRAVPMILPRPKGIVRWVRGEPAIDLGEVVDEEPYRPSPHRPIRELRVYLLFLMAILAVLVGIMLTLRALLGG